VGVSPAPRIAAMFLADYAEQVNGKLYCAGGGFNQVAVPRSAEGGVVAAYLALMLEVPWNDTNRKIGFEAWVSDLDGNRVPPWAPQGQIEAGRPPEARGQDTTIVMALPVPVPVPPEAPPDYTVLVGFRFGKDERTCRLHIADNGMRL
jgi:hypothetical protein